MTVIGQTPLSECAAVYASLLQYLAVHCSGCVCCSMWQGVAVWGGVLQCVAVCCSLWQGVAVCVSVLQYLAVL